MKIDVGNSGGIVRALPTSVYSTSTHRRYRRRLSEIKVNGRLKAPEGLGGQIESKYEVFEVIHCKLMILRKPGVVQMRAAALRVAHKTPHFKIPTTIDFVNFRSIYIYNAPQSSSKHYFNRVSCF